VHARFRTSTTDAGLAALVAVSMMLLLRAHRDGSLAAWLGGGAAAGLAGLAKGLHGLLLPFLALALLLALRRDGATLRRPGLWLALLAGAGVFGAWVAALHAIPEAGGGPEAVDALLYGNIAKRFGERAHHQGSPWHYVVIAAAALPWTPLALAGALVAARRAEPERERLLGPFAWVVAILVALTAASGKRTVYLLPLMPGVALLAAGAVDAAARGALGPRLDATVRWTVAAMALPLVPFGARRWDLRVRAAAAAALVAAGSVAFDAWIAPRENATASGRVLAERAVAVAGDRPLVLFRVGQGDLGQFLFPLRRTLPAAWDESELRAAAAGRPVLVLAERSKVDEARAEGPSRGLSAAAADALRPVESGVAGGTEYTLWEWDGR